MITPEEIEQVFSLSNVLDAKKNLKAEVEAKGNLSSLVREFLSRKEMSPTRFRQLVNEEVDSIIEGRGILRGINGAIKKLEE